MLPYLREITYVLSITRSRSGLYAPGGTDMMKFDCKREVPWRKPLGAGSELPDNGVNGP